MRQLANGTQAEIARANRAWALGQQAIKDYQHTVAGTPKSTATYLELHGETEAQAQIRQIKAALAGIPRSISTRYFVTQTTRINKPHVPLPGQSADGSTVPKGGAYQDVYPYLLAPGEEVISNRFGQADRYRPLLKAINATRLGPYTQSHLALAAGGTVGRPGHRPHQRLAFPSLD
jgi:hypothetical protein